MSSYNTVTVAGSATLILAANINRKSYIITNTSTTAKLYIGPDSSVTTATGTELETTGGNIAEDSSTHPCWLGDIYGISSGTVDARYWERT